MRSLVRKHTFVYYSIVLLLVQLFYLKIGIY